MKSSYDRPHLESIIVDSEQPLSLVVKGHYAIDKLFDEALRECLPNSNRLDVARVAFLLKADLLIALGVLNEQLRPSYFALNTIRNWFAHDPYTDLNAKKISDIKNNLKQTKKFIDVYSQPSIEQITPIELVRLIIATSYIFTARAIDVFKRCKVENLVAYQMMNETVSRFPQPEHLKGLSVDVEFRQRVKEILGSDLLNSWGECDDT